MYIYIFNVYIYSMYIYIQCIYIYSMYTAKPSMCPPYNNIKRLPYDN